MDTEKDKCTIGANFFGILCLMVVDGKIMLLNNLLSVEMKEHFV